MVSWHDISSALLLFSIIALIVFFMMGGCANGQHILSPVPRSDSSAMQNCTDMSTGRYDSPYYDNDGHNECARYYRNLDGFNSLDKE